MSLIGGAMNNRLLLRAQQMQEQLLAQLAPPEEEELSNLEDEEPADDVVERVEPDPVLDPACLATIAAFVDEVAAELAASAWWVDVARDAGEATDAATIERMDEALGEYAREKAAAEKQLAHTLEHIAHRDAELAELTLVPDEDEDDALAANAQTYDRHADDRRGAKTCSTRREAAQAARRRRGGARRDARAARCRAERAMPAATRVDPRPARGVRAGRGGRGDRSADAARRRRRRRRPPTRPCA